MNLNKSTLSEQIYQILHADIVTSRIPMGEKLTLKMLQERFGVSSTPVREALTRLSEEGLVVYYSNIGVKVISLQEQDLRELYSFMGDLDALAIRYAAAHPDQTALLHELEECVDGTQKMLELDSLTAAQMEDWIACSDQFHLLFYKYCGNSRLVRAAQTLRSQLTIFSNQYETDTGAQRKIDAHHRKIWEAYVQRDVERAAQLMKAHLDDSFNFALATYCD